MVMLWGLPFVWGIHVSEFIASSVLECWASGVCPVVSSVYIQWVGTDMDVNFTLTVIVPSVSDIIHLIKKIQTIYLPARPPPNFSYQKHRSLSCHSHHAHNPLLPHSWNCSFTPQNSCCYSNTPETWCSSEWPQWPPSNLPFLSKILENNCCFSAPLPPISQ